MGGNLLTKGKRTSRDKYLIIEKEIRNYLNTVIGQDKYRIPRYYNTKPDFGDLDVIIDNSIIRNRKINEISFKDKIQNELELPICKFNSGILTTLYKDFQVDYFPVDKSKLPMYTHYMDYNIGNFIGKIGRRFNLKYGMDGLTYVYRGDDNHYKREKFITNDIKKIFELFDLDYLTWKNGFNSNTDSYNWLIKSKYFSTYTYLNPKPGTKKKAKERPEFNNFIQWLKDNNIERSFQFTSDEGKYDLIQYYFPNINIKEFIEESDKKYKQVKLIRSKFNGNIIMELIPNLKGKSLGIFMDRYKKNITDLYGNFDNFIVNSPQEIINKSIIRFYGK
jgi:hypothetical protein